MRDSETVITKKKKQINKEAVSLRVTLVVKYSESLAAVFKPEPVRGTAYLKRQNEIKKNITWKK